jgi:prophage antirepressor-like protein
MLTIFHFENQEVHFVGTYEKPEWVAKDVCLCLGLTNVSEALKGLDSKDLGDIIIPDTMNRQLETNYVNS